MILRIKKYGAYLILTVVLTLVLTIVSNNFTYAEDSPTPTPTQIPNQVHVEGCPYNNLSKCVQFFQEKVSELNKQGKTLASQIAVMSNQIQLTEARIKATKQEISDLTLDIDTTTKKISHLQNSLNSLTEVLLNRIVATYETSRVQPFEILLSSNNFSNFFSRLNYLKIAQAHDKKLIYATQQAKNDYANQKEIFENKKKKVEALKNQLEAYTNQLAQEKKDRESLLEVTQSDEKRYQTLLEKARAEREAIERVLTSIQLKDGSPIKEGEAIAVVGNTGYPHCSTGPHLHFEVRKNGVSENPNNYLKAGISLKYSYGEDKYYYYGTINPQGNWNWPLKETIQINQGYGSHGYAKSFYPDGIHHGIDMDSDSSIIKAPKDGTLYKGTTTCKGAAINYVAIDHGDGIVSWYWHVQ
ncbi:MAG: peptidoglycan DD-metalloendopeptidase family protein [Patescibacteria group bacterium]